MAFLLLAQLTSTIGISDDVVDRRAGEVLEHECLAVPELGATYTEHESGRVPGDLVPEVGLQHEHAVPASTVGAR
jgi:hypothetical protein